MKRRINRFGLMIMICIMFFLSGNLDQTTKDALKVQHLLRTIERNKPAAAEQEHSAEVSEKELNAFISYRLKQEKDPMIKRLKIGLMGADQLRGKLNLDATYLNLDFLVGNTMELEFTGKVHTRNGTGRIEFSQFHLNGQVVDPGILKMVVKAAGKAYGGQMGGLDDWYELPKGVDRLTVKKGKVVLYY